MLIDALEHLDSPPARLNLLASNQRLQADNLLSSRVATIVQQHRSRYAAGWQNALLRADFNPIGGLCWAAGWSMHSSRDGQDAAEQACHQQQVAKLWLRLTLSGLSRSATAVPSARNSRLLRISK